MSDALILKPRGKEVCVSSPDGAYVHREGDGAQIIVIGPTRWTPLEYEIALREMFVRTFELQTIEFMTLAPGNPPEVARIMRHRSFVNMMFVDADAKPKSYKVVEGHAPADDPKFAKAS
jgi:hypothetical protein